MKRMSVNPVSIVQEYMNELRSQYRTTDDPQQKDVLGRRLRNLQNVRQFLSATQSSTSPVRNDTITQERSKRHALLHQRQ